MFKVRFSATVKNFDTEEEFNGWVSPSWSRYALYTERDDVQVEEFDTLEEAVKHIEDTIGSTEHDAGSENYYAEDVDVNHEAGEHWYRAGHIEES
jgi:hypothetical protein